MCVRRPMTERPQIKYKSRSRSAITNGTNLLPDTDHRSKWMRRLRDIGEMYISDLGGIDNMSTAEHSLIRRIATLTVELEKLEAKFATTEDPSDKELAVEDLPAERPIFGRGAAGLSSRLARGSCDGAPQSARSRGDLGLPFGWPRSRSRSDCAFYNLISWCLCRDHASFPFMRTLSLLHCRFAGIDRHDCGNDAATAV